MIRLACGLAVAAFGCGSSSRPDAGPAATATHEPTMTSASAAPPAGAPPPAASSAAAPAPASAAPAPAASAAGKPVRVVSIGMHVAGGPFDEPTKVPFKKAVEPHFPEMAECWAKHVPHPPPKQADVGVDLLIEAAGGHPKVSNPRSTLPGGGPAVAAETKEFVPCIVTVFEAVEFPKLVDRGRTGVSYSLRFTP